MKKGQEIINALSDAKDMASDIAEIALDSVLNDGVIKDIPLVGSFMKLVSMGKNISGYLFARKLYEFYFNLKDIPKEKIEAFKQKLNDENIAEEVGERLLLIINQADEIEKCKVIGIIFSAYIEEKISHIQCQRLCLAVNKVFIPDLTRFVINDSPFGGLGESVNSLLSAGFISISGTDSPKWGVVGATVQYTNTETGDLIRTLLEPKLRNKGNQ